VNTGASPTYFAGYSIVQLFAGRRCNEDSALPRKVARIQANRPVPGGQRLKVPADHLDEHQPLAEEGEMLTSF
jgi:hypothetical protein